MDLHNKIILVTGAEGFIGSHLAELLAGAGHEVRALVQYNSFNNIGWLAEKTGQKKIEVVLGDIRDPFAMKHVCGGIDVILHLAALIAIPYSYQAPQSYLATNVLGTQNLCEAALASNCQRFIHVSTSEVYGSARYVPIDELHPIQPQSPYSASKVGADAVALSYFHSFGLPVAIARPFNTYGPRQSARAIIPTIIGQILAGQKTLALGNTHPTRDFTYVSDTCQGLAALAAADEGLGEVFNIGSDQEIAIAELAQLIGRLLGETIAIANDAQRSRPAQSEVDRLRCNYKKLHALTGFTPSVSLTAGLQQTIAWLRDPVRAPYHTTSYTI